MTDLAVEREATSHDESFQALTPEEAAIVKAAAARIFPTTDTPGATEAGVIYYIDRTLNEAYRKQITDYRAGCAALDRHATAGFGAAFTALKPEQQDTVLTDFDKGEVTGFDDAKDFFALLRKHTMEGMFSEPSYGGNRGMVGWRLVGFPGQQFGYAHPYIDVPLDIAPVAHDAPFSQQEALDADGR